MQTTTHGFMGGYGLWWVLGVLLAMFLVVAIVKMVQKKIVLPGEWFLSGRQPGTSRRPQHDMDGRD